MQIREAFMSRLMIISDDFTGALDTGIQFVKKHVKTAVFADDSSFSADSCGAEAVVINSDTRNASSEKAYSVIRRIVREGRRVGIECFYKKTDSALRGNIGSELQAVMDESGTNCMQFVLALPHMNRYTLNGVHYIDGIPAGESIFAHDNYSPVRHSAVADIIHEQSDLPVIVHTGTESGDERGIHVYDARTEEDLAAIAAYLKQSGQYRLLAGCSGMAQYVPELLDLAGTASADLPLRKGLLVICGSTNQVTKKQLEYAEAHGMTRRTLSPRMTLDENWVNTEECSEYLDACMEEIDRTGNLIIDTNDKEAGETEKYASEHGLTAEKIRTGIASTLGILLRRLLDNGVRCTLLLTGGDTLLGFMRQIGASQLTPVREEAPGVVLSQLDYNGCSYPIITKSGGFGNSELFFELAERTEKGDES